eukprot:TRINITY_DN1582_c0_g1_i1.p1 TRINITY_DN1582_c0_g1~~TRINITY_DN1582_c0_g1_i1.p1  ORF type:complete len:384 (+),score=70.16 TRINITY_DN1582_c0_g1_i1:856-2007(+)
MITQSIQNNIIFTTNWSKKPLPIVHNSAQNNDGASNKGDRRRNVIQEETPKYIKGKHIIGKKGKKGKPKKTNQKNKEMSSYVRNIDASKVARRRNRFKDVKKSDSNYFNTRGIDEEIVGTCQDLEKSFLRLTKIADPENVRPIQVLKRSLEYIKMKWRKEQDWDYTSEQFKSIRQDLIVQKIKNEFTVEVYETHARLSLENKDIPEFLQCQAQLLELYQLKIPGSIMEFTSYTLLYTMHENNSLALNRILARLTPAMWNDPFIKHALKAREALALSNYHQFFKLYWETPNMGQYIMDLCVDKMRMYALKCMARGIRPNLSVEYIQEQLAFETIDECIDYLVERECSLENNKRVFLCPQSYQALQKFEINSKKKRQHKSILSSK